MDPPPAPAPEAAEGAAEPSNTNTTADDVNTDVSSRPRRESSSQHSEDSQTAADFIRDQMQLEADAREALPYSIDNCTKPLGSLRQNVFACLTCHPPPENPSDPYEPVGVCYSCSIQCHGEHELVEIFQKRNFTCDCGTTRFSSDQKCTLRINPETNTKGGVHSEPADPNNKYNQNFRNRFCSCSIIYNPQEQKGTMFQCLGLGTHETGGCGEDWYHPGCLVGLGPKWYEKMPKKPSNATANSTYGVNGVLPSISEDPPQEDGQAHGANQQTNGDHTRAARDGDEDGDEDEDPPLPDGFPGEDDFDHFICYKCVEAHPWIKRYAGTSGFLPPVFLTREDGTSRKRKLDEDLIEEEPSKRVKSEGESIEPAAAPGSTDTTDIPSEVKLEDTKTEATTEAETEVKTGPQADLASTVAPCKLSSLPPAPTGRFSLFVKSDFREHLCHCASCFPLVQPHPQLLEEEEAYEPPLSDGAASEHGGSAHGSGASLLERGESALKNVDRVRAIEGVMAYNHLKEQLTPFFRQFAESGRAIGAEDIKEYFAKLRGDDQAIRDAGRAATDDDHRKEQEGY
ncbi:hypothetical protein SLS62_003122 [Diatrype stigma]|uniref:UBR-type domain-containing protein n=1 Tax=Diatrype stigma TaxID=117547 RepID=A0AAN9V779_9PEZI